MLLLARERERERVKKPVGIPIGNLTSQLFANVYLNELDQFVKHELRVKYYVRYTDDFAIVSHNRKALEELLTRINAFLLRRLKLTLHPHKVVITRDTRGVDFLGYVAFPHHRLLRTKTRHRIWRKMREKSRAYREGFISEEKLRQSLQSYLGVLSHANAHRFGEKLKNNVWFCMGG